MAAAQFTVEKSLCNSLTVRWTVGLLSPVIRNPAGQQAGASTAVAELQPTSLNRCAPGVSLQRGRVDGEPRGIRLPHAACAKGKLAGFSLPMERAKAAGLCIEQGSQHGMLRSSVLFYQ